MQPHVEEAGKKIKEGFQEAGTRLQPIVEQVWPCPRSTPVHIQ
jgi:hypothetical protein